MDQGHAFSDEVSLPFLEHGGADADLGNQEQDTGQSHADRNRHVVPELGNAPNQGDTSRSQADDGQQGI